MHYKIGETCFYKDTFMRVKIVDMFDANTIYIIRPDKVELEVCSRSDLRKTTINYIDWYVSILESKVNSKIAFRVLLVSLLLNLILLCV